MCGYSSLIILVKHIRVNTCTSAWLVYILILFCLLIISCCSPVLHYCFVYLCEYPGAAYCQLMDWLFPGSLDLSRVRFLCNMVESIHNYILLQAAFREVGVVRVSIVTGEVVNNQ